MFWIQTDKTRNRIPWSLCGKSRPEKIAPEAKSKRKNGTRNSAPSKVKSQTYCKIYKFFSM